MYAPRPLALLAPNIEKATRTGSRAEGDAGQGAGGTCGGIGGATAILRLIDEIGPQMPFSDEPTCCGAARRTGRPLKARESLVTISHCPVIIEVPRGLWQHPNMIEFRTLTDDHPDLAYSPLLRGALLTMQYAQKHGSIALTKNKAFKRVFVHWAVKNFDWPGKSAEKMFRYNKVINEFDFPPLEVLHLLLISQRLGRHFKDEFRLTKRGTELAQAPGRLFAGLIPYFVFRIDHASYARFDERPFGKWDVWMNVINVEADHGTTEAALFETFYGEPQDWHTAGWREMAAFSSCVLRPLEWAGLLIETREDDVGKQVCHVFKTPLWRSALKLETDDMLRPLSVQ